jgi:ATP-dependent RNA helicase RhlE
MSTHFRNGGRPQGGRFSNRGFGGGRPSFQGRSRNQSRGHGGERIDVSRFINKATPIAEVTVFVPKHHFKDFAVDEALKNNIIKKGYETPTPIQDTAIPHVLSGSDVVGIANTGTGKTAAFLIPLINAVLHDRKKHVLIMVPTRELATQIEEEFWTFADHMRIGAVSCVGGANISRQISTLRRDPNFVIGTPGRLKDLMSRRALDLSRFSVVVLDEADRMLDMGFIHDMRTILSHLPKERQTLFFSATLSREIEALIGDFLKTPVRVSVKTGDTSRNVDQDVIRIEKGKQKIDVLHDLLAKKEEYKKVLVFGRTKHGVEKISKTLVERGFKAESIHGNKSQNHRARALDQFKQDRVQVLVATDVAARGIDVDNVSHVINFDLPGTYDDYVHRIGRTGRAGGRGKALTFID